MLLRLLLAGALLASFACLPAAPPPTDGVVLRLDDRDCRVGDDDCAFDFGDVADRAAHAFNVVNLSVNESAAVENVGLLGDGFTIEQAPPAELTPAGFAPLVVTAQPPPTATATATLSVLTSDGIINVALRASGTSSFADLAIEPALCDFGDVVVGDTSAPCNITFRADGAEEIELTMLTAGAVFNASGPLPVPAYLAPGAAFTVAFVARPPSAGPHESSLTLMSGNEVLTGRVQMRVLGVAP